LLYDVCLNQTKPLYLPSHLESHCYFVGLESQQAEGQVSAETVSEVLLDHYLGMVRGQVD